MCALRISTSDDGLFGLAVEEVGVGHQESELDVLADTQFAVGIDTGDEAGGSTGQIDVGLGTHGFDNFNFGKYDDKTIDFENGQTGAIMADFMSIQREMQVVERVEGNYALMGATGDPMFGFDVAYLNYVFNTLGASSIEFTVYRAGYTSVQAGAFRTGVNNASGSSVETGRTTAGITYVEDRANGKVTVTVAKAAYEQWFNADDSYKNNVSGVSSVKFLKVYTRLNGDGVCYFDDFKINK